MKVARPHRIIALLFLGALFLPVTFAQSGKDKQKMAVEASSLFGLDKLLTVHVRMTPEAWEAVQPPEPERRGPQMVPLGGNRPEPNAPRPDNARGGFGIEFAYVHGDIEIDGQAFKDAGVRFKGNSSYMASRNSLKHPFKFDFDRYVKDGEFRGLTTLNFSNNSMDPAQMREALSYEVFRQAGVPYARTAFVKMYLTVPGKYDHQYVGLYTMVEQVDEKFLKRHFNNDTGLLLKPERVGPVQYLGEKWDRYKDLYQPKSGHKGKDADQAKQRLIEFTRLVNRGSDEDFKNKIESYVDIDEFLRFLAANALLANMDSFLGPGHNYYLYLNPATNKFVFIPWDLNQSFGGMFPFGSAEQQSDLSIAHPHAGNNRLIERLLAMEKINQAYREHLQKFLTTAFNPDKLAAQIAAITSLTATAIKDEPAESRLVGPMRPPPNGNAPPRDQMMRMGAPPLKEFIAQRAESVRLQLTGKRTGYVPQNRGPGGPGMMMNPSPMLAQQLLKTLDADGNKTVSLIEFTANTKLFFANADTNKSGTLDQAEITVELSRLLPAPPGVGQGGMVLLSPPDGRPMGFGGIFAMPLMRLADADQNGVLSKVEWEAASQKVFTEADADKNGVLDEKELAEGIGKLLPRPMGPPPPQPKKEGE